MRLEATVGGMDCSSCAAKIEHVVRKNDDVTSVRVDVALGRMQVDFHAAGTADEVAESVRKLGYTVDVVEEGAPRRAAPERPPLFADRRFLAVLFGVVMVIAATVATYVFDAASVGVGLYVAAVLAGGVFVFRNAFSSLRHLHLDINVLMTLAVVGAIILGEWFEASTVVVLFAFAEWLEGVSMSRARGAIRQLMELAPSIAHVLTEDGEREVEVTDVGIGARVSVRPGERIPLDGTVVTGTSDVDQSAITGESVPVSKGVGDEVFAGTLNDRGHLVIEVTATAGDTTLAHVLRAVEEAQENRSESERFIERFARWYTPAVVVLAALVVAVPPLAFGGSWDEWFYRGLVLLVIACPCALVIATPITTVSGLARAARDGILVKGGTYLEALDRLRTVVFDKTGTLTRGRLVVAEVRTADADDGISEEELLRMAAAVEQRSEHYLAKAIVGEAVRREIDIPHAHEFLAHPGEGAEASLGESNCGGCCSDSEAEASRVLVGARRMLDRFEVDYSSFAEAWREMESRGGTVVGVACDGTLVGLIECRDEVRHTAVEALEQLRAIGVEGLYLSTGDNAAAAQSVAQSVGIHHDHIRADLLPNDKVSILEQLKQSTDGTIAMVGDGINDAPSLAAADVGIAMGAAGTDVALESAHVALMGDDLSKLPEAVEIGRQTVRIIRQNVALAIGIKVVVLALAAAGVATLWMAIAADMGASLLVIGNGLRLVSGRRSSGD